LDGEFGKKIKVYFVAHRSQSSIENYKRQNHVELFCGEVKPQTQKMFNRNVENRKI